MKPPQKAKMRNPRLSRSTAKVYFQTADLFAWTVTIVAVSVVFERLFLALVDRLMGKAGL